MTDPTERLESVPLENIHPHPRVRPHNPDKLAELIASMCDRGQIEPARGRPKDGFIELYVGHGRYLAAKELGRPLKMIIAEKAEEDVDLDMLHENLKREELDPITEAQEYNYLIKTYGWSQDTVGQKVGKSQQVIAEALALLTLAPDVRNFTAQAVISKKHGYHISKLNQQGTQSAVAKQVIDGNLNTDQTEALVKKTIKEETEDIASRPKAAVKTLNRLWPNLPSGVLAKLETGWVTLRWSPKKYTSPKAILQELAAGAPDSLDLPKPTRKKKGAPSPRLRPPSPENGEGTSPPSSSLVIPKRAAVPVPQIQDVSYVGGNKLQIHWAPAGEGFSHRFFRTYGADNPQFQPLADGQTVSTHGALVNVFAGGDPAASIAVMAIDPQGHESELSQPIRFDLKPWNNDNTVEPLSA